MFSPFLNRDNKQVPCWFAFSRNSGISWPALLRRSHVGKLINIYKKVVGECHLGIKLVVEVDVDEEMFLEKKQLYGMTKWSHKLCQNFSLLCRKMMKSIWGYSFLG